MRTVRYSGRLGGGLCPGGVHYGAYAAQQEKSVCKMASNWKDVFLYLSVTVPYTCVSTRHYKWRSRSCILPVVNRFIASLWQVFPLKVGRKCLLFVSRSRSDYWCQVTLKGHCDIWLCCTVWSFAGWWIYKVASVIVKNLNESSNWSLIFNLSK